MVKKKTNKVIRNTVIIILLLVFAFVLQPFNLISDTNQVVLEDTQKTDNYYTLKPELVEKDFDTSWGANKGVLTEYAPIEGSIPDNAYANDVTTPEVFCNAQGGNYISISGIIGATRYNFNSGKWSSDGFDEDVATMVKCAVPSGDYVASQGKVIIKDVVIDKNYDSFELVYESQLNNGDIDAFIVFEGQTYEIDSPTLPFEDFEGKTIDIEFIIIGTQTTSPKLFDTYQFNGVVSETNEEEEIVINEEVDEEIMTTTTSTTDESVSTKVSKTVAGATQQDVNDADSNLLIFIGSGVIALLLVVIAILLFRRKK